MKWDLAQLYSQLDLQPDCSLEEFKRSYQRRIAELHPDRGADAATPEGRLLLPELIWLYATATRFHRRHGRLPGASLPPRNPTAGGQRPTMPFSPAATSPVDPPFVASRPPVRGDADETPPHRTAVWAIALLVVLLIVTFSWGWLSPPTPDDSTPTATEIDHEAGAISAATNQLELGMGEASVIAIQGNPMLMRNTRWDYGPSWVEFEQGRLVDWHSSPLHPLKTATPSPISERPRSAE